MDFSRGSTETLTTGTIETIPMAMEDANSVYGARDEAHENSPIINHVLERFQRAKDARLFHEQRWMRAYRNFIGRYAPDFQFTDTEKSRVFIKITKTKVLAAYGQVTDVLFAGNKFPIGVEPSPVPEGIADAVHLDPQAPQAPASPYENIGFEGDGKTLAPGTTFKDLLGPFKKLFRDKAPSPGPGKTPTSLTVEPAKEAARKLEKRIHDQVVESSGDKHLRYTAYECAMLGTGVMKGPFTVDKEYPKWVKGQYQPTIKAVPVVESVPLWDIYPDPDAMTADACEFIIQRHKLSRAELRALKSRPAFRKNAIDLAISQGPNYVHQWWEETIRNQDQQHSVIERFEVYEYWGLIDYDTASAAGITLPDDLEDKGTLQVNIWVCGNNVLRFALNPFKPTRTPYHLVPYELNPYSIFGIGVAENMDDTQSLMNGFMRMAVDNGILSGNVVFDLDESMLVPGQDLRVYPGKVFRRSGGNQAIQAVKFPNTTNENLQMFDKARQLADESTGIPSYSHGQTGISGVGRTAAGISMLMGASATNIKSVIKNFDDYLLRPLGMALFAWNMQFSEEKDKEEFEGDLEIVARGTDSLLRNEVRQQKLMTLLQVASSNQNVAPFVKFDYVIRELAAMLDLDPDKTCNNPAEAALQAMTLQQWNQAMPQPGTPAEATGGTPQAVAPEGGTMSAINSTIPGESGFTANTGGGQNVNG